MNAFFFILGRNPALSVAEIISVLNFLGLKYSFENISAEVLVLTVEGQLDPDQLMKRLGGTVKIGRITDEVGWNEDESYFQHIFSAPNLTDKYISAKEGKLHIGVSIYNTGSSPQYVAQLTKQLKSINLKIKENLKKAGFKPGYVQIKGRFIASVSVVKNRLLTQGFEMVLLTAEKKILVGKTSAVQDFESFSFRDYQRPRKDKRSGIMPPKLARMMINLTGLNNGTILDPFCGSGTIIQEAVLLGYKKIIGTDICDKAISDTQYNLNWLFPYFREIDKNSLNLRIEVADVGKLRDVLPNGSVDTIVTEPYLGQPLYKSPDLKTAEKTYLELKKLYLSAFAEFHKVLRVNGTVVIIFPAFKIKEHMYFFPIIDEIKKLGFEDISLASRELLSNLKAGITARNSIIYGSEGQFVHREILKFSKN